MSQKIEDLSALVDGEMQNFDFIKELKNDAELSLKWQSYHLIRDGLRKELPVNINVDFAANVAQALASEPAILAPKKTWRDLPLVSTVVPFAKQGGQMAIAASVAVAMILGVQQINQPEIQESFNAAPTYLGIQGGLSPVSLGQTRAIPRVDKTEQNRRINAYLTDHQQQMRLKSAQMQVSKSDVDNTSLESSEEQSEVIENTPK